MAGEDRCDDGASAQGGQPPTSAAQLETRVALRLLDVQERAAEQRGRNLDQLFLRLEEIHAGQLTFLAYP